MPTEVIRYVDPDAIGLGDGTSRANAYTSLFNWNAAEGKNLSSVDETHRVRCLSSGGTADIPVVVDGWAGLDATHFITIEADVGHRASKTGYDLSKYRVERSTSGTSIEIKENFTVVDGLQIKVSASGSYCIQSRSSVEHVAKRCWFEIIDPTSWGVRPVISLPTFVTIRVWNCIFHGPGFQGSFGPASIYNCTFYGAGSAIGIQTGSHTQIFINCSVGNYANDFDLVGPNDTVDHCASDDGDGTNPIAPNGGNWANEFKNPSVGDFTLLNTGNLKDAGLLDPSSGLFNDDIDGNIVRQTPWDIGADQYRIWRVAHAVAKPIEPSLSIVSLAPSLSIVSLAPRVSVTG